MLIWWILGIYKKKLCEVKKDLNLLINYFSRNYPLLIEKFTSFINDEAIISKTHEGLTLKDINKRFQKLKNLWILIVKKIILIFME